MESKANRRNHERFPFRSSLEIRPENGHSVAAKALDVSVGGLRFETDAEFKVGDQVHLAFQVEPQGFDIARHSFVMEARVCHVARAGEKFLVGAERLYRPSFR